MFGTQISRPNPQHDAHHPSAVSTPDESCPPARVYDDIVGHPRYHDEPTPQDLGAQGVVDVPASTSVTALGGQEESRLDDLLIHRGCRVSVAARHVLWKSQVTQMMAATQGHVVSKSPVFGPRHPELACLTYMLVDTGHEHQLDFRQLDSLDVDGAMQGNRLVAVSCNRQIGRAHELTIKRNDLSSHSPIMVLKHRMSQAKSILRFTPQSGKGVDAFEPDAPRHLEAAKRLAEMYRPALTSLMHSVSIRWANDPVVNHDFDSHDGMRWLWIVADELGLSSSQYDELNWVVHDSLTFFRQSRDLLIRI